MPGDLRRLRNETVRALDYDDSYVLLFQLHGHVPRKILNLDASMARGGPVRYAFCHE